MSQPSKWVQHHDVCKSDSVSDLLIAFWFEKCVTTHSKNYYCRVLAMPVLFKSLVGKIAGKESVQLVNSCTAIQPCRS